MPERTLVERAPRWYGIGWLVLLAVAVLTALTRPWYLGMGVMAGFVLISWMVGRGIVRRAVWLTPDEVLVVNGSETIAVPRRRTEVRVVDGRSSFLWSQRDQPEWDNTTRTRRLVYLVHHGDPRETVHVEAALGHTPRRLNALVETLKAALDR